MHKQDLSLSSLEDGSTVESICSPSFYVLKKTCRIVNLDPSHCWFARVVMAAMLVIKNKSYFSPQGTELCFHVNYSRKNSIVLTPNMAALSRGLQTKNTVFVGKLCNRPLGMQNGRIRNAAVTSSSRWDNKHAAHLARLHNRRRGVYMGSWSARTNNAYQWLQMFLGRPHKVVRVSTQGRPTVSQWVTSYYLLFSQDGVYFAPYFERNTRKVRSVTLSLLKVAKVEKS